MKAASAVSSQAQGSSPARVCTCVRMCVCMRVRMCCAKRPSPARAQTRTPIPTQDALPNILWGICMHPPLSPPFSLLPSRFFLHALLRTCTHNDVVITLRLLTCHPRVLMLCAEDHPPRTACHDQEAPRLPCTHPKTPPPIHTPQRESTIARGRGRCEICPWQADFRRLPYKLPGLPAALEAPCRPLHH